MRKIKFVQGKIYHIFNRSVEKRNIFDNETDKWRLLQGMFLFNDENNSFGILHEIERKNKGKINFLLLKEFVNSHRKNRRALVRILADCLMSNHFHLLIEEIQENGISRFMHKLETGYANYFNKKYNRVGSLFQGRFKATAIENDLYLQYLLVYINVINPGQLIESELKEKGVMNIEKVMNFAENYSFGTHPDYLGIRDSIIIDKGIFKEFFPTSDKYREFAKDVLLGKKYNIINNFMLE